MFLGDGGLLSSLGATARGGFTEGPDTETGPTAGSELTDGDGEGSVGALSIGHLPDGVGIDTRTGFKKRISFTMISR